MVALGIIFVNMVGKHYKKRINKMQSITSSLLNYNFHRIVKDTIKQCLTVLIKTEHYYLCKSKFMAELFSDFTNASSKVYIKSRTQDSVCLTYWLNS